MYENQSPAFTIPYPPWAREKLLKGEVLRVERPGSLPAFTAVNLEKEMPGISSKDLSADDAANLFCESFKALFPVTSCNIKYAKTINLANGEPGIEVGLIWNAS